MTRSKLLIIALLTALPVLGWTLSAQAHGGRTHDQRTITEGRVVGSTLFVSGQQISMGGEVEGDMFCAGQDVTITGRVEGDVICAAQDVRISGTVTGDVRVLAQTVTVSGDVEGSLSAAAQIVRLEADSRVGRDISAAATEVITAGAIGRDLRVTADSLRVDGQVGRDVEAEADRLSLGSGGRVGGDFRYQSPAELRRDQAAQVAGRISRDDQPAERDGHAGLAAALGLYLFVAMLLTSMALVLLIPAVFHSVSGRALGSPGKTALIGFTASILMPLLIVTLMLTLVGLPLGLLLLAVWLVLLFLSGPFAAYLLGRWLLRNGRYKANALVIMLAGGGLLLALYLVPVLNLAVGLVAVWFGLGSILYSLGSLWRGPRYDMTSEAKVVEAGAVAAKPKPAKKVRSDKGI